MSGDRSRASDYLKPVGVNSRRNVRKHSMLGESSSALRARPEAMALARAEIMSRLPLCQRTECAAGGRGDFCRLCAGAPCGIFTPRAPAPSARCFAASPARYV